MIPDLSSLFDPVMEDIVERATVADSFIDKNIYKLLIAILWANVVLKPGDIGLEETDLEQVHELVNGYLKPILGNNESLHSIFKFINSRDGERTMKEARLTQHHKELLLYFASMILDPEGHKKWMASLAQNQE
tara:strand:+ start:610 stop:1008 length:399 start_codon:yes stop_codon:yes gene_type:complete